MGPAVPVSTLFIKSQLWELTLVLVSICYCRISPTMGRSIDCSRRSSGTDDRLVGFKIVFIYITVLWAHRKYYLTTFSFLLFRQDSDYTHLWAEFTFERRLGYAFIQIYAPTVLIVVLSWLSFWIAQDAVPARVALGVTTVLTIVTLMGSFRSSVPKVRETVLRKLH